MRESFTPSYPKRPVAAVTRPFWGMKIYTEPYLDDVAQRLKRMELEKES
jgi:hypothetical protein